LALEVFSQFLVLRKGLFEDHNCTVVELKRVSQDFHTVFRVEIESEVLSLLLEDGE